MANDASLYNRKPTFHEDVADSVLVNPSPFPPPKSVTQSTLAAFSTDLTGMSSPAFCKWAQNPVDCVWPLFRVVVLVVVG